MVPLSCLNCCHNPLQLGPVGTSFGYCTRHELLLTHPQLTTCGQLLRKDLLAASAERERALHAATYAEDHVALVTAPGVRAEARRFVEAPNGQLLADDVVEEVQQYGTQGSKIATMAALHRIRGARAEVAMLSLSRAYFANCVRGGGAWTAGVHLLFWTLKRLEENPALAATDLRGPIGHSLGQTIAVARWLVVTQRLALVSDVARQAAKDNDPVAKLGDLAIGAVKAGQGADPDELLGWLAGKRPAVRRALSPARYAELRKSLHESGA